MRGTKQPEKAAVPVYPYVSGQRAGKLVVAFSPTETRLMTQVEFDCMGNPDFANDSALRQATEKFMEVFTNASDEAKAEARDLIAKTLDP